jgi:hypothetical protein
MSSTRIYKLSRGQTENQITEAAGADSGSGAAMTSELEVRVNLAANWERAAVMRALRMIENWLLSHRWPPA